MTPAGKTQETDARRAVHPRPVGHEIALRVELREAALAYHRMGWRVVPVALRSKKPTDGDGWQTERFKRDEAAITHTWEQARNVGVLLGPESGELVDVDLDCAEAITLANEYLTPTWTFGRPGAPRSHRLYIAAGAHLLQLRDSPESRQQQGQMLVELRAKPAGGLGAQTVLPPSIHTSGEQVAWDPEDADALETPATVDTPELFRAVRRLAVHAFLARHLGGIEAARSFIETSGKSGPPAAPEVLEHARLLEGLPPSKHFARTMGTGSGSLERWRSAGIESAAYRLGLEWDPRRRALRVCPGCRADTRSDHDRRSAAGVVISRTSGYELAVHGKCGFVGDAVTVAIAELIARSHS